MCLVAFAIELYSFSALAKQRACFTIRPPRQWATKTSGRFGSPSRRPVSCPNRARALPRIPAAELFRYMSPLYPKDRTRVHGRFRGRSEYGHNTALSGELDGVYVHVSMGWPSRPWTRTKLKSQQKHTTKRRCEILTPPQEGRIRQEACKAQLCEVVSPSSWALCQ